MFSREILSEFKMLSEQYRVITITGPRQAGKTTLSKLAFPDRKYISLEDPDIRNIAENDPRAFFRMNPDRLIIDEIQRVPKLLSYIQTIVDEKQMMGQFILTGSHQLELNEAISQSLAGRTALLNLYPMSIEELSNNNVFMTRDEYLISGFMPAVHKGKMEPSRYYRNYFQTYVERDVRRMINLKDISLFETFIRLCAGRIGQLLNVNSLASDVGVNSNTIKHWLSILEASYIILRLKPYYENLGKRLVKSPKLYFTDVGLASYLLGLETKEQVSRDPLRGQLFENMVVMELIKARANRGKDPEMYFYRDSNGNEVDVIFKQGRQLLPIEIKSAETFDKSFFKGLKYFKKIAGEKSREGDLIYSGEISFESEQGITVRNFEDSYQSLT